MFNQIRESSSNVVLKAKAESREWQNNATSQLRLFSKPRPPTESLSWTKPDSSHVKCNFNAGLDTSSFQARGGWIIRDHQGVAKVWGSIHLNGALTPLIAETKALLAAMQQTWIHAYTIKGNHHDRDNT